MRILDIDMDYFLKDISSMSPEERLEEDYIEKWTEEEIINFFEKNLGLDKNYKIPGCIIKTHDEAITFLDKLIEKEALKVPFEIIHIDSHSDLGLNLIPDSMKCVTPDTDIGKYMEMMKVEKNERKRMAISYKLYHEGNYLLYAIAFGWLSKLTYCTNPTYTSLDFPEGIIQNEELAQEKNKFCSFLQLDDIKIPFRFIKTLEDIQPFGKYDFIIFSQSPKYTPASLDFALNIAKNYINVIY